MKITLAQPGAASHEHLHGDEDDAPELTAAEQQAVDARADELIAERLTEGPHFCDLMTGLEPSAYDPYLHRALMNIDNARAGDPIATTYILAAMWKFQNVVKAAAALAWREECQDQAERELHCGGNRG